MPGFRVSLSIAVVAAAALAAGVAIFIATSSAETVTVPEHVKIWEAKKGNATEGETIVAASPDDVYAAVADHAKWTAIFPNLAKVTLKSGKPPTAVVTVVSKKGKSHTLTFDNDPKTRTVRFTEDAGRALIHGTLEMQEGDDPGTTRVHATLRAEVKGAASLLVTKAKIRSKRQSRISKDLAAIRTYFARP